MEHLHYWHIPARRQTNAPATITQTTRILKRKVKPKSRRYSQLKVLLVQPLLTNLGFHLLLIRMLLKFFNTASTNASFWISLQLPCLQRSTSTKKSMNAYSDTLPNEEQDSRRGIAHPCHYRCNSVWQSAKFSGKEGMSWLSHSHARHGSFITTLLSWPPSSCLLRGMTAASAVQ